MAGLSGREKYPQSGDGTMGGPSGLEFVLAHLKVCTVYNVFSFGSISAAKRATHDILAFAER